MQENGLFKLLFLQSDGAKIISTNLQHLKVKLHFLEKAINKTSHFLSLLSPEKSKQAESHELNQLALQASFE